MIKRCNGCGAVLQTENSNLAGYVPDLKFKICQRCHKLTNYGEVIYSKVNKDNDKLIDVINKNKKHVFFLIDFLNINDEVINTYKKINSTKNIIITKKDIIPKSIKDNKIIDYLHNHYLIKEDIYLVSSKKRINSKKIINIMEQNNILECYIVGYTNVGKSTLINNLLEDKLVTVSNMPNTTIDFINIKVDNKVITDTPGFNYKLSILDLKDYLIKKVNCKNEILPKTYQTKENLSILIEDDIIIKDFGVNSITTYFSNDIKVEKKFNFNTAESMELEVPNNSDLVINGLGFINIKKQCKLKVNSKYLALITIRKSIFGGNNND